MDISLSLIADTLALPVTLSARGAMASLAEDAIAKAKPGLADAIGRAQSLGITLKDLELDRADARIAGYLRVAQRNLENAEQAFQQGEMVSALREAEAAESHTRSAMLRMDER